MQGPTCLKTQSLKAGRGRQFAGVTPPGRVRLMSFYLLAQFCLTAYKWWLFNHMHKEKR